MKITIKGTTLTLKYSIRQSDIYCDVKGCGYAEYISDMQMLHEGTYPISLIVNIVYSAIKAGDKDADITIDDVWQWMEGTFELQNGTKALIPFIGEVASEVAKTFPRLVDSQDNEKGEDEKKEVAGHS